MKTKYLSFILAGLVLCMAACKKTQLSHPTTKALTVPDTTVDVYVAGYVVGSNITSTRAAYWKNGVLVKLGDSLSVSVAYGIAVQGTDVYVAGFIAPNDSVGTRGVVWKNGIPQMLYYGADYSQVNCITLLGSDVYVGGYVADGAGLPSAIYWKNGVGNILPADPTGSLVNAITLNGSDVYIAGETNANNYTHIKGTYWKNGGSPVIMLPADTTLTSFAFAIASAGSDVDVAGSTKGYVATYWKNGAPTTLGNAAIDGSYNYGIATNGNDVFVVGGTTQNNLNVATLWKNNVPTYLTSVAPLHSMAKAIALNGPDVYIAGSTFDNIYNDNTTAYYWKNGVAVKLSNPGAKGGWANAIVVVSNIKIL